MDDIYKKKEVIIVILWKFLRNGVIQQDNSSWHFIAGKE